MFKKKEKQFKELSEGDVQSKLYGFDKPSEQPKAPKKESPKKASTENKENKGDTRLNSQPKLSRVSPLFSLFKKPAVVPVCFVIAGLALWFIRKPSEEPPAAAKTQPVVQTIKYTDRETDAVKPYTIQVAVYENEVDSKRLIEKLGQEGLKAYISPTKSRTGKMRYRIYVEEFTSLAEGKPLLTELKGKTDFKDSFLRKK